MRSATSTAAGGGRRASTLARSNPHAHGLATSSLIDLSELAEDVPCQTLVSVSKRSFRLAVDRNRIKRLMREAWRTQKHAAYAAFKKHEKQRALVLIYVGKELPTLEGMQTSMQTLIAKMIEALAAPVRPQPDALKDE